MANVHSYLPTQTMKDAARVIVAAIATVTIGCSTRPVEGPDKMFSSTAVGAMEGAGVGAVTGIQATAASGPGVAIGAGFGAAVGAIHGVVKDQLEENEMENARRIKVERRRSYAQEALVQHYKRRMAIHPTRDIYPADLFFEGDSAKMCPSGVGIVREIARLNDSRLPYSRLVIAAYAKSVGGEESTYIQHLTDRRSREFVNQLVKAGVEPRRLETRSVIVDAPLLIDPNDDPTRYNQAIEIIPIDR